MKIGLVASIGLTVLGIVGAIGLFVASLRPEPGANMVLMALPMCFGLSAVGLAMTGLLLHTSPDSSSRSQALPTGIALLLLALGTLMALFFLVG